jgi:hypothetical protein
MRRAWSVAVVVIVVLMSGILWPAIVPAQSLIWRQRYTEALFRPTEWSPCPSPPPTGCQCLRPQGQEASLGVRMGEGPLVIYTTTSEVLLCGDVIQHTSTAVETLPPEESVHFGQ